MPAALTVDGLELTVYPPAGESASALATWTGSQLVGSLDFSAGVGATVEQATVTLLGDLSVTASANLLTVPATIPATITGASEQEVFRPGNVVTVDVTHELTSGLERIGRLRMADATLALRADGQTLEADVQLENWLWATLRDRLVTGRIRDEPLADALQRIIDREAPDITLDYQLSVNPTVSATFDAEALRVAVTSLIGSRGQAFADGTTLRVRDLPSSTSGSLDLTDLQLLTRSITDNGLATRVRVDGGTLAVRIPDATQSAVDGFVDLTNGRRTVQLSTAISELDRVELRTKHNGADGQLVVRLQADDGGQPVAPDNPQRDIASRKQGATFVSPDGRTAFEFPEHDIPTQDPWLLVEQQTSESGPTPFTIGVGSDGNPTVTDVQSRQPLVVETRDGPAESEYARRDVRVQDKSLSSFDESVERGERVLDRKSSPSDELVSPALSTAAYNAQLLDAYDISIAPFSLSEPFVVTDITTTIETRQLTRSLTFRQPPGFDP